MGLGRGHKAPPAFAAEGLTPRALIVIATQVSLTSGEEETYTRPQGDLEAKARFELRVPTPRPEGTF